jgi:NADH:ubiquinone oxidoreductase subunit H
VCVCARARACVCVCVYTPTKPTLLGSNRVGFVGPFQPFSDAIKHFTREQYFPLVSNYIYIYIYI